jgi:hypothetical protein
MLLAQFVHAAGRPQKLSEFPSGQKWMRPDDIVEGSVMEARYPPGSNEYKYDFNMQVSAQDIAGRNRAARQRDVVF